MEEEKKTQVLNFKVGAITVNGPMFHIHDNTNVIFNQAQPFTDKEPPQVTDVCVANAIMAINGNEKPLNQIQLWVGVCCLLSSKYGYPRNMKQCCERINALPLGDLEYPCNYESVRKLLATNPFIREDARQWDSYKPRENERSLFNRCLYVAQEFEKEIQKQILEE